MDVIGADKSPTLNLSAPTLSSANILLTSLQTRLEKEAAFPVGPKWLQEEEN
jgi:hypothetical protein